MSAITGIIIIGMLQTRSYLLVFAVLSQARQGSLFIHAVRGMFVVKGRRCRRRRGALSTEEEVEEGER